MLDSDRNKLTKQMYDHYMQQAEETDLKKLNYPDGFQRGNSKKIYRFKKSDINSMNHIIDMTSQRLVMKNTILYSKN